MFVFRPCTSAGVSCGLPSFHLSWNMLLLSKMRAQPASTSISNISPMTSAGAVMMCAYRVEYSVFTLWMLVRAQEVQRLMTAFLKMIPLATTMALFPISWALFPVHLMRSSKVLAFFSCWDQSFCSHFCHCQQHHDTVGCRNVADRCASLSWAISENSPQFCL